MTNLVYCPISQLNREEKWHYFYELLNECEGKCEECSSCFCDGCHHAEPHEYDHRECKNGYLYDPEKVENDLYDEKDEGLDAVCPRCVPYEEFIGKDFLV